MRLIGQIAGIPFGEEEMALERRIHWTVAATLIHELAHTNGAPGGNSHAAEATLSQCLLRSLEVKTILGEIERARRFGGLGIA